MRTTVPVLTCLIISTLLQNSLMTQQNKSVAPPPIPERTLRQIAMMPLVYRVPGMDEVTVKSDLNYNPVNEPHLLMDVYAPEGLKIAEHRPAVLFIHGSVPPGAPAKNMGVFKSWGRLVAASGLVGVTFTHRLGYPKPMLTEAANDVTAAIDYVRSNADALHVESDKLCLAAFSGGGPLLSLGLKSKPAYVRCLVAFYAYLDLQQSELHRTHETAQLISAFSPITYLNTDVDKIPPIFIARAGLDQTPTLNDSIDRFVQAAISKNAEIIVANHPRGIHGFDILTDDDTSREIIRSALEFMKNNLGLDQE